MVAKLDGGMWYVLGTMSTLFRCGMLGHLVVMML
jgi:hypothetical protein